MQREVALTTFDLTDKGPMETAGVGYVLDSDLAPGGASLVVVSEQRAVENPGLPTSSE